jgi:hypothetical protein
MKLKQIIYTSFILLFCGLNNAFSQNLNNILKLLENKSVIQFYKEIKESSECSIPNDWSFQREIVNNFKEHYYSCNFDDTTYFTIKMLSKDSLIIMFKLDYEENFDGLELESNEGYLNMSIFHYYNKKYIEELDACFKSTFGENLDFSKLYDPGFFGTSFGISGQSAEEYSKLKEYISYKDTTSIMRMIGSSVWETQLFGVLGFVELQKNGFKWGKIEIERAKAVIRKKGKVRNGKGCSIEFDEIDNVIKYYGLQIN